VVENRAFHESFCAADAFCRVIEGVALRCRRKFTIEDYIRKHGLIQRRVSPEGQWIPATLVVPRDDDFQVFGNDDGTHVVVLNTTKRQFKIMHGDMVFLETEWLDARRNYETDARPFWE
jgi:hypothetical protein